jgi:choice-of-anchor B domain-containing protein
MTPPRASAPNSTARRRSPWSTAPALVVILAALAALATPSRAQESRNVTLLAHLNPRPTSTYSSCWSYVHSDGREYAVLSAEQGISIVRLTNPTSPVEVGFINLRDSGWHESRQYGHHLYVVTEVFNGVPATCGLEVIDMSDPDRPQKVADYNSTIMWAHTIEIDADRGLLYASGANGGTHVYSLADPAHPAEIAVYPDYAHDTHVRGHLAYASLIYNGVERILDVTNPANPIVLKEFATPYFATHSAWTTEDARYLYVTDEVVGFDLTVYDISDLTNVRQVWRHEAFPDDIAHNPRIRGNVLYLSHYNRGVRLWDVSNGAWPVEFAYYDFVPYSFGGFHGNWEVAPYFPSGIFVASSIEDGLWVFRPSDSHGIVRGTVRDGMGNPIVGATVRQLPNGPSTRSASDGRYALAIDTPSKPTLEFSAFTFQTTTQSLNLRTGDDRTIPVTLALAPAGTIRAAATRSSDGAALGSAEVEILGTPLRGVTDAAGSLVLGGVPEGTYQVRCVRPGFGSGVISATVRRNRESALAFALTPASFYDGFDTDLGWTVGGRDDEATVGIWLRAAPNASADCTPNVGQVIQPGADHSPDPGSACFVTGNGTIPCFFGQASVQGGQTTLTSPVISLAGLSDPRIGFWRWYVNRVTNFTADDPLVCQISGDGGETWVTVQSLYATRRDWEYVEIRLLNHLSAPSSVRLRWIASDRADFSIVEALIDDVAAFSGPGGPALAMPLSRTAVFTRIGTPSPSPTTGAMKLDLRLAKSARIDAAVFDARGRFVTTLHRGMMTAGEQQLGWDGRTHDGQKAAAGIYFVRVRADGQETRRKFAVVR